MGQRDSGAEVIALKAEGRSVREIALVVGLSKSTVQRLLQAAPVAALDHEDDDVDRLTDAELAYMGWTRAKVAAGLNELEEYRLGAVFSYRAAGLPVPVREVVPVQHVTKAQRDERILELRAEGYTLQGIADALPPVVTKSGATLPKMTKAGVSKALVRLIDVYDETDLDDVDDDEVEIEPVVRRPQAGAVGRRRQGWRDGNA